MKRRELLATVLKNIAIGTVVGRYTAAQEDLDPVKLMPDTHKVIFENSFVRVVEGRVPAGGREIKHRHRIMLWCSSPILTRKLGRSPMVSGLPLIAALEPLYGTRPPCTKSG